MNNTLQDKLYEDFPDLFREKDLPMSKTCMCWGICCEDGWEPLIRDLCEKLSVIRIASGVDFCVKQVKEKMGTLRFYLGDFSVAIPERLNLVCEWNALKIWQDIAIDLTVRAEDASAVTCEVCGAYARLRKNSHGWMTTLCDNHAEAMEYRNVDDELHEEALKK